MGSLSASVALCAGSVFLQKNTRRSLRVCEVLMSVGDTTLSQMELFVFSHLGDDPCLELCVPMADKPQVSELDQP